MANSVREFVVNALNQYNSYLSDNILSEYVDYTAVPVEKGIGTNSVQQKGTDVEASGIASFAEGSDNLQGGEPASGEEKLFSKAEGYASHSEGAAHAIGRYSHAEGGGNSIVSGHPTRSTAEGQYSHAEGSHTYAKGGMTHAEGNLTIAEGYGSHAEGSKTLTTGNTSHAEGINTVAGAGDRPSISTNTDAGNYSHAEGNGTQSSGNSSHAEGKHTLAEGPYSHAEGLNTRASGQISHAEGHSQTNVSDETVTKSNDGIIEDWNANKFILAKGAASHAEGKDNLALGNRSHAEGYQTIASGTNSHSENYNNKASGANSHAEGASCEAKGERSHVEGFHTETNNASEHAEGTYNKSNTDTRHSIGIGTSESDRKNAFEVMKNGDIYLYGIGGYNGTAVSDKDLPDEAKIYKTIQDVINSLNRNLKNYSIFEKGYGEYSIQRKADTIDDSLSDAFAEGSFAEGMYTITSGKNSHAEGDSTKTNNQSEHAEGSFNKSNKTSDTYGDAGNTQHSVGIGTLGDRKNAFEIMQNGDAYLYGVGDYEGTNLKTDKTKPSKTVQDIIKSLENDSVFEKGSGKYSIQQKGTGATASGIASFAEGYGTYATDGFSHAEGNNTYANGMYSHAEGQYTYANNIYSHAEGQNTYASGMASHAEGFRTIVNGQDSHVEGSLTYISASAKASHAEGETTYVLGGPGSHSEGMYTYTYSGASHVEGFYSINNGFATHVEGNHSYSYSSASGAHAEGIYTYVTNSGEHGEGIYNFSHTGETDSEKTRHSIGIGSSEQRKNAFEVMANGDIYAYNIGGYDGTNPSSENTLQQVIGEIETKIGDIESILATI